jgi:hypothetical protein
MIVAAAPDGAPPRRISNDISEKHRNFPPCPLGGLKRGALVKIMISFPIFIEFGVNSSFMPVSTEQTKPYPGR